MSFVEVCYKKRVGPTVFARTKDDAELAHEWGLEQLIKLQKSPRRSRLAKMMLGYSHPSIETEMFGLRFNTPLGLAAGFDKYCQVYWGGIPLCGWSFCEVGGITLKGQEGNPRVRMLRSKKYQALWNWMGFNNPGAERATNTMFTSPQSPIPVGLNVGKGKDTSLDDAPDEYAEVIRHLWRFVDFLVLNPSSPNTPGLRNLQSVERLSALIQAAGKVNGEIALQLKLSPKPLGVKLAPDMTPEELVDIIDVCIDQGVDFVTLFNSSVRRDICPNWDIPKDKGGVSGKILKTTALEMTKIAYRHIQTRRIKNPEIKLYIIGVGGIHDAKSLYERIRAGATLCQIYSAWPFEGPDLAKRCCKGLVSLLKKDGYAHVSGAVGVDAFK